MRQVTKEEFYGPIYRDRLNVHPRIVTGRYPYTTDFIWLSNPHRVPYGRIVGRIECGTVVKDYYLP